MNQKIINPCFVRWLIRSCRFGRMRASVHLLMFGSRFAPEFRVGYCSVVERWPVTGQGHVTASSKAQTSVGGIPLVFQRCLAVSAVEFNPLLTKWPGIQFFFAPLPSEFGQTLNQSKSIPKYFQNSTPMLYFFCGHRTNRGSDAGINETVGRIIIIKARLQSISMHSVPLGSALCPPQKVSLPLDSDCNKNIIAAPSDLGIWMYSMSPWGQAKGGWHLNHPHGPSRFLTQPKPKIIHQDHIGEPADFGRTENGK